MSLVTVAGVRSSAAWRSRDDMPLLPATKKCLHTCCCGPGFLRMGSEIEMDGSAMAAEGGGGADGVRGVGWLLGNRRDSTANGEKRRWNFFSFLSEKRWNFFSFSTASGF